MSAARELTPEEVEAGKRGISDEVLTATQIQALVKQMDASKKKWRLLKRQGKQQDYETKLKDENFQVARLAFMQHFFEAQQEGDTTQTSQVKEVEFKLFKLKLVQEQNTRKSHLMRVHEWHTKTHEAKHNLNSTLHALRQECVETHCSDRFPTCICSETREATLAVASRVLVSPASTGAHYSPSLVQRSYWACREARKCKLLCRWRRRSMPSCRAWQMAGACPGTASTRCTSRTSLALGQVMQAIVST
jgi:hypothetical protein